jgi:hypothetical protein
MKYVVKHNGSPVQLFNTIGEALAFKRYCMREYNILTTLEEVLV